MKFLILLASLFAAENDFVDVLSESITARKMDLNTYKDNLKKDQALEKMGSPAEDNPDTFIIHKMVDDNKILSMHLFDLNRDGKIEIVKHFESGKLKRTETVLDRQGNVFTITDYNTDTGNPIKKVSFDQEILTTRLHYKNELRREEIDRNLDGKIDMWVHYRDGKVLKTEVDENYDGENIKVIAGEKPEI